MSGEIDNVLRQFQGELDATGETGNALGTGRASGPCGGSGGGAAPGGGGAAAAPSDTPQNTGGEETADGGNADKGDAGKKKKGRRPELIPLAVEFFTGQGAFFHRYREEWWVWSNEKTDPFREWGSGTWGGWFAMSEEAAQAHVNGWLQSAHPGRASMRTVNFILDFLKSPDRCMVNESREMPMFLDGTARNGEGDGAGGWLVMKNCMVNIEALAMGEPPEKAVMPLAPILFSLERVSYPFLPGAACPRWMQYLDETFPDADNRRMLQMMFGLCMVYDTSMEVIFILFGKGGTGKSTALGVLKKLLGEKRSVSLDPEELSEKHSKGDLAGVKVNLISELPDKLPKAQRPTIISMFKKAASGESIKREPKNRKADYPVVTARIIACANALPDLGDKSGAVYRRLRIIMFTQVVPDEKKNPGLLKELSAELPGIFNWAVEGLGLLRRKYRNQFPRLGEGAAIVESVKADADAVGEWLRERFEKCPGVKEVWAKETWEDWKNELVEEEGQDAYVLPYRSFCREVQRVFELGKMERQRKPGDWTKLHGVFVGIRRKAYIPGEDGVEDGATGSDADAKLF